MGKRNKQTLVEKARAAIKENYTDKGYSPVLNKDGSFSWKDEYGNEYTGNGPGTNQYNYNNPIHRRLNQEVSRITQGMLESQKQQQLVEKDNPLPKETGMGPIDISTGFGDLNYTYKIPLVPKNILEPKDSNIQDESTALVKVYNKNKGLTKHNLVGDNSDATTNPFSASAGSVDWYLELFNKDLNNSDTMKSMVGVPYEFYGTDPFGSRKQPNINKKDYDLLRIITSKFGKDRNGGLFSGPRLRSRLDSAIKMFSNKKSIPDIITFLRNDVKTVYDYNNQPASFKMGGKLMPKAQQGTKFRFDTNTIGSRLVNKASQFIEPALDLTMFINQKRLINKIKTARQSVPVLYRSYTKAAIRPIQGMPQSEINSEENIINDTHNTVASSDPNIFIRSAAANSASREKMMNNISTVNAKVILGDRQRYDKEVGLDQNRYNAIRDANAVGEYNKEVSDVNATAMADQEKRRINSLFITQILHNLAGRENYVAQNEMFKVRSESNTIVANRAHLEQLLETPGLPIDKREEYLNQIKDYNDRLVALSKAGMPTQNQINGAAITGTVAPKLFPRQ